MIITCSSSLILIKGDIDDFPPVSVQGKKKMSVKKVGVMGKDGYRMAIAGTVAI